MTALILSWVLGFALVATRLSGFVVISPWPGQTAPATAKTALVVAASFAVTPAVGPFHGPVGLNLFPATFFEFATGAAIGFVFRLGLLACDVLGAAIGQAVGLTLSSSYDPILGSHSDPLTRILTSVGAFVALTIGAHRFALLGVLTSFREVPLAQPLDVSVAGDAIVTCLAQSFECGLELAVPVITVSIAASIVLGLATRTAPALQALGVALPLTLASGFAVLIADASDVLNGLAMHLETLPQPITVLFGRS